MFHFLLMLIILFHTQHTHTHIQPAILNDINKGTLPMAELHNYSGGTYQWLDARLADLAAWQSAHPNQTLQIVFMHHQGYRVPIYIPNPAFFTFSAEERHKVQALLLKHFPADTYWGVIAGHIHRWYNDTAFDEPGWENFWQWETDACKGQWDNKNIHSGWSLVRVGTDNRISSLERVIQPMSLSSVENQVVQERNESFHKVIG